MIKRRFQGDIADVARRFAKPFSLEILHRIGLHGNERIEYLEHHVMETHRPAEDAERNGTDFPIEVENQECSQRRKHERCQRESPGNDPRTAQASKYPQWLSYGAAVEIRDTIGQHVGCICDVSGEAANSLG